MWMFIFLWVSVGFLFLWVVFQQACLFGLNERLETLKHLHLNLDADTDRRFGRLNADAKNAQDLMDSCSKMAAEKITSLGATVDVLCDRVAALEKKVDDAIKMASDLTPRSKPFVVESNPDRRFYEIDWNKLNSGYGTGDRFFSNIVSRMDELKPKVSSAGDDHRAAEVLPGSPAATIGSQANNSSAFLETMRPKPSELLKLFNSPPIICAEGAVLVKRKGV